MHKTPLRLVVEQRLGQDIEEYVRHKRRQHPDIGLRRLADAIYNDTRGVVMSRETLRRWLADLEERAS